MVYSLNMAGPFHVFFDYQIQCCGEPLRIDLVAVNVIIIAANARRP